MRKTDRRTLIYRQYSKRERDNRGEIKIKYNLPQSLPNGSWKGSEKDGQISQINGRYELSVCGGCSETLMGEHTTKLNSAFISLLWYGVLCSETFLDLEQLHSLSFFMWHLLGTFMYGEVSVNYCIVVVFLNVDEGGEIQDVLKENQRERRGEDTRERDGVVGLWVGEGVRGKGL